MKELVEFIVKALVDDPDQVRVEESEEDGVTILRVSVASEDMGKIIGKQGRTAKAIRTLLRAASLRNNKRVTMEIV